MLVAIARDVTERRRSDELLLLAATRDPLTGLANRACFHDGLNRAFSHANLAHIPLGLMVLDLDDFKQVNDSLGHDAGDALLQSVASRLSEAAPGSAGVARLGGDEFAVLVLEVSHAEMLSTMSEDILAHLRAPLIFKDRILDYGVTIGAALFPGHGSTPDAVLKSADIALYAAKADRRGGSMLFQSRHRTEMHQHQTLLSLARSAIREDGITPFYQPKVALANQRIYGFEALLRWRHLGGEFSFRAKLPRVSTISR
ncbi:diguanylate cyclase [Novosphingobium sp. G106]|uniref:GGDEF domain-containing protein n=1 Tax=Novosphingobium sp. G106 TaxID=2849500 RepID=UPI001C2D7195|nr:GGDEF domain-containing protein [Novosphingobium sp. G106]MBV1692277.1 diguanylate cyclase [Novosphingobium sp. G106]